MESLDWLSELPTTPEPPDLRAGLRALADEDWLVFDSLTPAELQLRTEILDRDPTVVCRQPGYGEAEHEMLEEVRAFVAGARPESVATTHSGDPLRVVATLVTEDLCLMARVEGTWRLVSGTLLFPNQWSLAEKLGGDLMDIHGPVDGYEELLKKKVDTFFDHLEVGRMAWRRNWFLHDSGEYYQPDKLTPVPFDDPAQSQGLFVRSERETLRKLPNSGAVVFGIKTQIASLSEVRDRPELAQSMARYLREASPRAIAGKDADGRHEAVARYLTSF